MPPELFETFVVPEGPISAETAREVLEMGHARRGSDLSHLDPESQTSFIASRATEIAPSPAALTERIRESSPLTIKLGIDPTASDVHLGHVVPMIMLNRFLRMGHHVVLIIGDITAKIGDPSGRSTERPPLTDAEIARNMATYADQVSPFFDVSRADIRHNSEWLAPLTLPQFIELLSQVPIGESVQREDFRKRLSQGHSVSMAEFVYSVVMAYDSVAIEADVEIGGSDQLLNMHMGRHVQKVSGQEPQVILTLPLVEGIDGSGAKMSKSSNNYVALTAEPSDMFGKVMSIPDRLIAPYLQTWTEWTDPEIERLSAQCQPMELKLLLAADITAAVHGVDAALDARTSFLSQFSRKRFSELPGLPVVTGDPTSELDIIDVLTRETGFASSRSAARRLVEQDGVRLVAEAGDQHTARVIHRDDLETPFGVLAAEFAAEADAQADVFLKVGRKVASVKRLPG